MVKRALFLALTTSALALSSPARAAGDHDPLFYKVSLDRLEWTTSDGNSALRWEGEAFVGGDSDKAMLTSRGVYQENGSAESAEVQALWSHTISDYFDLQTGIRGEFAPTPERASLVLGVEGLAPYWIETKAHMFVSTQGVVSARFEADTDLALTTRLILQPSVELMVSSKDDAQRQQYAGLQTLEGGLRLRYEVTPNFAPYVGVTWERALGATNVNDDAEGHDDEVTSLVSGIKLMF